MKLREYEGKRLFQKYGIEIPRSELLDEKRKTAIPLPLVLKAQVLSGDRKKSGGILFVEGGQDFVSQLTQIFGKTIECEKVKAVLAEENIDFVQEYYVSISYDTNLRAPVLVLSSQGGSGIMKAKTFELDITFSDPPAFLIRQNFLEAGVPFEDVSGFMKVVQSLWQLFCREYALLVEINPLFKTTDGKFIAGDAKVILDDEKTNPGEKRFISMGGDIAILASGGGASMLNMDSLLSYGGKPANYAEYSGNPKADVVKNLTMKVLGQSGLNGLWVVGGTANFTDIYETLSGFLEGLESLPQKPEYPILIRRDGPRRKEAQKMVEGFAAKKGYNIHFYGSELSMDESARMMVQLAKEYRKKKLR